MTTEEKLRAALCALSIIASKEEEICQGTVWNIAHETTSVAKQTIDLIADKKNTTEEGAK